MTLIIEDGSIVPNANSYVDEAAYTQFAADRGLSIGADTQAREIELILAMDYLQNQDYQGWWVEPDNQLLMFPRSNVWANGRAILSSEIPRELKNAQMEGAAASNSQALQINEIDQNVASEKLDTLSISYHSRGKSGKVRLDRVDTWLAPLLATTDSLVRT